MTAKNVPQSPSATSTPKKNGKLMEMPESLHLACSALNERYVFIEQIAQIVRIPTESKPFLDFYHPTVFVSSLEAPRKAEGLPVARRWINWHGRRSAYRLVYAPGQPRFTNGDLNTWIPSKVKAKKGDVTLWLDYLDRVFAPDPTYREWFLAWLAYPIQNPGVKLHTAVVFWSEQTATGKSMLGWIMSHIYGQHNYAQLDESTLHNPFNFWANGRQFIMGEEMRGMNSAKHSDRLKAMITQKVIYVNIKNKAQFELADCLNYYFTSNHPDAFYIDSNDRRFFVHNLGDKKYPADLYRDKFEPWFLNGGAEAVRWYLESIDLAKPVVGGDPSSLTPHRFNPGSAAPQSKARKQMVLANRDESEEWLDDLLESPEMVPQSLITAPELYKIFSEVRKSTKIPYKTFCTRLRARIAPVYADNKLTLTNGTKIKVYPLRGEWVGSSHSDLVSAYEGQMEGE